MQSVPQSRKEGNQTLNTLILVTPCSKDPYPGGHKIHHFGRGLMICSQFLINISRSRENFKY